MEPLIGPLSSPAQASGQDKFSPWVSEPAWSHVLKCRFSSPQQICIGVARKIEICMVAISLAISRSDRRGQCGCGTAAPVNISHSCAGKSHGE